MVRAQTASLAKQPEYERQHDAYENARDDGKVETEVVLGLMNVPGQSSQPAFANAQPQYRSNRRQHQTHNHQQFTELVHTPDSVVTFVRKSRSARACGENACRAARIAWASRSD